MANKKISELPSANLPITSGTKFEAVQGGINVQVDADDMPGSGAVDSVNGQTGVVNLDAGDVGADPAGSAAAAQAAAIAAGVSATVGVQDFPIPSTAWWPRVTSGCSPLAQVEIAGSLINIQTLDFNQTTQQYAQVRFTFQRKYNLSTITFDVAWSSTASSGSVVWGLSAVALADGDALNTSFGSQVNVTDAVGSANTVRRTAVSGAVTIGNTPAVSDAIFLQITRVTGDASDDMAADARLAEVRIFVPTNAAIDA